MRSFEGHNDWVNDLVLYKQYLISCSSDQSICLWNTMNTTHPVRLGIHNDYVKRLAQPKHQNWVVSGSLDQSISIWDLSETRPNDPMILTDPNKPCGSIYALTCTPSGNLIVSGSPDKFVRLWDPRLKGGNAQTHKLQGHSDAVRDVLVSEDGKWILSASSDTTIKLWSTAMPTTSYATYNYSESSLWCLATNSPTLSTFWAGARDGWVYKVNNKTSYDEDYSDAIVICKEEYPILRLAALEDEYIWTATSSSTINRWRDCPVGEDKSIIVPESCFCRPDEGSDDEGSSLPSKITSIHSGMDEKTRSEPILSAELVSGVQRDMHALWESPEHSIHGVPGIKKALLLNNKRHVITQDTKGNVSIWDIICCKKITDLGMIDFEQSCNTENTMEWLANWCTVDIKTGDLTIHLEEGKCYDCEMYYQDLNLPKDPANEDQRINLARWILTYLLHDHLRTLYPNNPSFCTEEKSHKKLLPLKVDGLSQFTALETPSMSVSLATPLTKFPSMQTPETNETSTTPLNTFVEENPLSPLNPSPIPMSPQASQESQEDPKKSVPVRNPSFIDKFKFRRGRTPSSKSQEESIPTVTTTPTRTTSFSAEKVILVNEPPEAEEFINLDETPHIVLPPNLPICFSIEQSPSMYIDTFHGTVRGLGTLKNSDLIPPWVQDWIIQRVPPPKDPAKLSFVLQKHMKSALPEMPPEANRLTANRMLRVKKVLQYLAEHINVTLDPACYGSNVKLPNSVYIELVCNGRVLSYRDTLASIKYVLCKGGPADVQFQYLERQ